jgi:phosphotransferase system HPr (HPr) family protein
MADAFVTQTLVLSAKNGLHIRPAEQLARLANQFVSQIGLIYESQRVDAKSIMEMLTLGAAHGSHLVIEARGDDAQQAVDAIVALVENEFSTDTATNNSSSA